ncbi:DEAD/DEAH box helicase [Sphingorhabdus arenilitoris]|uniref:DEAD/DEAH box helicase n=1 Tax=Sphingorhabdus arenilitoris TaxID=1490041 RepID=A0ABV8RIF6_9SPHN
MSYFEQLGLAAPILKALNAAGYDKPTPIQEQAIPSLMQGRDLCGIAQTGTGKTAAFALPSLHHFATKPKPRQAKSCRMLVLSPTRELAAQIAESFRTYGKFLGLSVLCIFGGAPVFTQKKKLEGGVDILVATPGRLIDLIEQRALTLKDVEIFVLDEADQMMDMGFIHALRQIDKLLPKKRQSLFFSATMPKTIAELGNKFLDNPIRVSVAPQSTTAERVMQYVTFVEQREKQTLLTLRLQEEGIDRALVFTRTKHGADRVVRGLKGAGIEAAAIHGNKSQGQRTNALEQFRAGRIKILVATDIAARGIDVPGVSHVFNFELPNVPEQYVHRIGRTARAGAEGVAMSFVADDERAFLRDIERTTRVKPRILKLPEGFREAVASLPPPAKKSNNEMKREDGRGGPGRAGQNRRKSPANGGRGRNGDTRAQSRPPQGGWQPAAGPRDGAQGENDRRPAADNRGGKPNRSRNYRGKSGGGNRSSQGNRSAAKV